MNNNERKSGYAYLKDKVQELTEKNQNQINEMNKLVKKIDNQDREIYRLKHENNKAAFKRMITTVKNAMKY